MVQFNKPFLPPFKEYEDYLKEAWNEVWLTNNGPLVMKLELELSKYLGGQNLSFVSSGTMALQIAIHALDLQGEIITSPFSYVATTSSIAWEGISPVFADIDPQTLNIDPAKIEQVITPRTSGIIAPHIFGNPCDITKINRIAREYGLKVIYDASQCFGSKYKGLPIFGFGNISTTSFHATKLFHTVEGGGVFCSDENLQGKVNYLRNFGHDGPEKFNGIGINGKNTEFHAAMGLANLKYIDMILQVREMQCLLYDELLGELNAQRPQVLPAGETNHSFYPLVFKDEATVVAVMQALESEQIFPRRYFKPSLSQLDYVGRQSTPVADDISTRILCLPLYHALSEGQQKIIAEIVLNTVGTQCTVQVK